MLFPFLSFLSAQQRSVCCLINEYDDDDDDDDDELHQLQSWLFPLLQEKQLE